MYFQHVGIMRVDTLGNEKKLYVNISNTLAYIHIVCFRHIIDKINYYLLVRGGMLRTVTYSTAGSTFR